MAGPPNIYETRTFYASIFFPILSLLAVFARIWARKITKTSLGIDDWLIVFDLVLTLALAVASAYSADMTQLGFPTRRSLQQTITVLADIHYAFEVANVFLVGTVKIAVLLFYRKIFVKTWAKMTANVLLAICTVWTSALTLYIAISGRLGSSNGYSHQMRPRSQGGGVNIYNLFYGTTDLFLDLAILTLPIIVVKSLQARLARKLAYLTMFSLGALCSVASAVRLISFVQLKQGIRGEGGSINVVLWSIIEVCLSITAACLPLLGPLFRKGHGLRRFADKLRGMQLNWVPRNVRCWPASGAVDRLKRWWGRQSQQQKEPEWPVQSPRHAYEEV